MEELRKQLFNLAVLHGLKSCYSVLDSLRDEVRAHGQFLVREYDIVDEVKTVEVPVESSIVHEETIKTEEIVKKVRKPRVKKIKEEVNIVQETSKEIVNEGVQSKLKGNEKKRWQREQEALKRLDLQSKGIFKQDVLTIENLTVWIKAGRSYAAIAREEIGCTEEEVSKFCKKHNIVS